MKKSELNGILFDALDELIKKDSYLFDHDVHEQTIASKLACYLSSRVPLKSMGGWDVDVEYNRNGEIPKSLSSCGIVKPDIIIHRRGLNNPGKTELNNLLILEIKKNPSPTEKTEDINKIKAFINEQPFYYCFGAFVELNTKIPNKYSVEWFQRNR